MHKKKVKYMKFVLLWSAIILVIGMFAGLYIIIITSETCFMVDQKSGAEKYVVRSLGMIIQEYINDNTAVCFIPVHKEYEYNPDSAIWVTVGIRKHNGVVLHDAYGVGVYRQIDKIKIKVFEAAYGNAEFDLMEYKNCVFENINNEKVAEAPVIVKE